MTDESNYRIRGKIAPEEAAPGKARRTIAGKPRQPRRYMGAGRFSYFESAAANDAARTFLEGRIGAILFPNLQMQLPMRIIGSSKNAIVEYRRILLKASTVNAQTTNVILYSPNRWVCLCDITRTHWGFCIFQSCREL
jgi:hypothetical protein